MINFYFPGKYGTIIPELYLILPFGPMLVLSLGIYVIQLQLAPKQGGKTKDPVWKLGIHLGCIYATQVMALFSDVLSALIY